MTVGEMEIRIKEHFPDAELTVTDLTGTEDHYEVFVRSARLNGLSRIEQHQEVMKAFAQELKSGEVHALSIRTSPMN